MAARHIIALLKSHVQGDSAHFLSVAMQVAAEEARRGHGKTAETIRELVDEAKRRSNQLEQRSGSVVVLQPRGGTCKSGVSLYARYSVVELSVADPN